MTLTNSIVRGILVDSMDADLNQHRWSLNTNGYPRRGGVTFGGAKREPKLHRIIASRKYGRRLLKTEEVDHINGNPLDNRRSNLRLANRSENMRNQRNRAPGVSGRIGVRIRPHGYEAFTSLDGQQFRAGTYPDVDEAAWMRDQWALALHGDFARLNFDYKAVA